MVPQQGVLLPFGHRFLANPSPVACWLAFPFASPSGFFLRISSKTSQPTAAKSVQNYRNCLQSACSPMSAKYQKPLPSHGGVYLQVASNHSASGSWADVFLQKPNHPYYLPVVDHTDVGLPHIFDILLQGELGLLRADWRFAFSPSHIQWIFTVIMCLIFVVGQLRQSGLVSNPWVIWISCSAGGWYLIVRRLMGGLPGAPEWDWGGSIAL